MAGKGNREGSLEAPTRLPLNWKDESFYDEADFNKEAERVYDICHGCRRCVSLCESFPVLFDLVDESPTMEMDGVAKEDYVKVVDECFLCDLCFQTKCPYVPPHEWNVDFPKLMLRGKAIKHRKEGTSFSQKIMSEPDTTGAIASLPMVSTMVNKGKHNPTVRKVLEKALNIHPDAQLPDYTSNHLRARMHPSTHDAGDFDVQPAGPTTGKVKLFGTCYGTYNKPEMGEDLISVLQHNGIPATLLRTEACCGMPKLEIGDLEAVEKAKNFNIPVMLEAVEEGWDIISTIPSCVLMFKQELPMLFPDDEDVIKVSKAIFDPFEYLAHRHKAGLLKTDFKNSMNKLSYQAACHQRVQNIGFKTREILSLIPGIDIKVIERCSGHDGSYAIRSDSHEKSMKLVRPVVNQVKKFDPEEYTSDCPLAASHIAHGKGDDYEPPHPISLLRRAYGI